MAPNGNIMAKRPRAIQGQDSATTVPGTKAPRPIAERARGKLPEPTEQLLGQVKEAQSAIDRNISKATGSRFQSSSREMLDQLGAPRAITRVSASALITRPPPRYAGGGGAIVPDGSIQSVAEIGKRVRAARRSMGMTQQRFADLAGVGRRFLIELERGKSTLEIGRVLSVCKAAGIRLGFY